MEANATATSSSVARINLTPESLPRIFASRFFFTASRSDGLSGFQYALISWSRSIVVSRRDGVKNSMFIGGITHRKFWLLPKGYQHVLPFARRRRALAGTSTPL